MESVYVAILRSNEKWKSQPILTSNDLDTLKRELDEYFNITENYKRIKEPTNRCLGFRYKRMDEPEDYEGNYSYEKINSKNMGNITCVDIYHIKYKI